VKKANNFSDELKTFLLFNCFCHEEITMTNDVTQQWDKYVSELTSKIEYLVQTNPKFEIQINKKLSSFLERTPPSNTSELNALMERGDDLLSSCVPPAFETSSNHREVPVPTESIADQAEKAKNTDKKSD